MSYSPASSRSRAGDGVTLRATSLPQNGSSVAAAASQQRHTVQMTNYPEHLNPFYKDDNHKRIRFLKVIPKKLHLTSSSSSSSSSKPKSERRSSFSVDGIKEIWKLRPFRSGNKKPMSPHVTKTSESPPQIRAALARQQDVDTFQDVPFQRSNRIRASMSEVNSGASGWVRGEDTFARNTRYRSTMGGTTGPMSPVHSMKPGTSQISIGSTNPFEEDMLDDDAISVSGYSIASMPNRPYRKKRRAPLPPKTTTTTTTTNKTDDDKASSTNPRVMLTSPSTESGETTQVEIIAAKAAATEIQSISSAIDAMIRRTESRESIEKETRETVEVAMVVQKENPPEERLNAKQEEKEEEIIEKTETNNNDNEITSNKGPAAETELQAKTTDWQQSTPGASDASASVTTTVQQIVKEEIEINSIDETVKPSESVPSYAPPPPPSPPTEDSLRIIESEDEDATDSNPQVVNKIGTTHDPYKNVVVEMEKYDVRYVPLKGEEDHQHCEATRSSSANNSKTVKDIIDSINKSQSLLKINVDEQKRRASNGSIGTRIRELERKESECNEMLNEIDLEQKISTLNATPEEETEIPVVIREMARVDEEEVNWLFKKCRPASGGGNHEWNPLPKPKRSHSSSPSTPN